MGSGPFWSTIAQTGKKAATGVATGAAVGYGARKAAKAVGLPEWAADSIASIASIYGASKGEQAIEFWQNAKNPSVNTFLQWIAKGRPTLTPTAPGKGTAVKYGGPAEPEYGTTSGRPVKRVFGKPARKLGPMSPEAPSEPIVPKAPKPFKKGPGRNMPKYGGPTEPEYGPAPSRIAPRRPLQPRPAAAEGDGEVTPAGTSGAHYVQPNRPPGQSPPAGSSRNIDLSTVAEQEAQIKNSVFGKRFKDLGMTEERVQNMTESEYEQYRKAINAERKSAGLSQFDPVRSGPKRRTFAELKAGIILAMKGTQ
jgi:hypothetical protein